MSAYNQRYDSEWVDVTEGRTFVCCDCGLVHDREYIVIYDKVNGDKILQRSFRNRRATAAYRRKNSVKARIKTLLRKKSNK